MLVGLVHGEARAGDLTGEFPEVGVQQTLCVSASLCGTGAQMLEDSGVSWKCVFASDAQVTQRTSNGMCMYMRMFSGQKECCLGMSGFELKAHRPLTALEQT